MIKCLRYTLINISENRNTPLKDKLIHHKQKIPNRK